MTIKKIYILGQSGSGKTTFAKNLSKKLKIRVYHLDDIVWRKKWTQRFSEKTQKKKLKEIYKKPHWIIEGVYIKDWILPAISRAEKVIFLNMPKTTLIKRVLKRSTEKKEKSRLYDKARLIYWILKDKEKIYTKYKKHVKEFIEIKNIKELNKFIKTIK